MENLQEAVILNKSPREIATLNRILAEKNALVENFKKINLNGMNIPLQNHLLIMPLPSLKENSSHNLQPKSTDKKVSPIPQKRHPFVNNNEIDKNFKNPQNQFNYTSNGSGFCVKSALVNSKKKTQSQKNGNSQNIVMNSQPSLLRQEQYDALTSKNESEFYDSNIEMREASHLKRNFNESNIEMRDATLNDTVSGRRKIKILSRPQHNLWVFSFVNEVEVNFLKLADVKDLEIGGIYTAKVNLYSNTTTFGRTFTCSEI